MYIFWAILGLIFLVIDFKKKSNVALSLATTFLFEMIIVYKFPKNYMIQVCCLFIFAIASFIMIKKIFNKEKIEIEKENSLIDFINKEAIVVKDIGKTLSLDGIGLIEFNNKLYQAKDIKDRKIQKGKKVNILSRDNMIFNVEEVV